MSSAAPRLAMDMLSLLKESRHRVKRIVSPVKRNKPGTNANKEGLPRRRFGSEEQSVQFAKELLTQGHHLQHRTALEQLCTSLAGSGLVKFTPHFTPSPLSSASLLGTYLKHRLLRNQESINSSLVRKIIGLGDAKNSVWTHVTPQAGRRLQFSQTLEQLNLRREALQLRLELDESNEALRRELIVVEEDIRKTGLLLEFLAPKVTGNLHPDALLAGDKVSMTPTEIAQLPSPAGTVRGILIRIKGPRKGNRAVKHQKSAGRVSINSVDYVVNEECSIQIPSKLGIFGLYIRIVYSKTDRLISPDTKLRLIDNASFRFGN